MKWSVVIRNIRFLLDFLVVSAWSLVSLVGCTEIIDMDLDSASQQLVVDGAVTNELAFHYVRLSRSIGYLDNEPTPEVSGATLNISDGESTMWMTESDEVPGLYYSENKFLGVPGRTYVLKIEDVDVDEDGVDEEYEASSVMPEIGRADSIVLRYSADWEIWKILLYAQDPPASEDYYMFRVYKNGNLISGNISEYSIVSDKYFDGNYANGIWVQSLDAGSESRPLVEGDVVSLQMAGINREFYEFIDAVQRENRGQYPLFSGPPANVPGNISNGALGFFTAYAVTYKSKLIGKEVDVLGN
jgi:hypothetical protein